LYAIRSLSSREKQKREPHLKRKKTTNNYAHRKEAKLSICRVPDAEGGDPYLDLGIRVWYGFGRTWDCTWSRFRYAFITVLYDYFRTRVRLEVRVGYGLVTVAHRKEARLSFRRVAGAFEPSVIGRRSAITLNQDL